MSLRHITPKNPFKAANIESSINSIYNRLQTNLTYATFSFEKDLQIDFKFQLKTFWWTQDTEETHQTFEFPSCLLSASETHWFQFISSFLALN